MNQPALSLPLADFPAAMRAQAAADQARPASHFRPPSSWMNDPNGTIYHAGWYHLFYQVVPDADCHGAVQWGHARSRDLVDWEYLPLALGPDADLREWGVYSGCAALTAAGEPRIFYTCRPHPDAAGRERFTQVAVRTNAEFNTFTRLPGPLLPSDADTRYRDDARDPFVFHANGRTWMVHGAIRDDHSVVLLHEALDEDLQAWAFRGEMLSMPRTLVPFFECPNMIPWGDRWLLLISPYGQVEGFIGTFADQKFQVERQIRLDQHDSFYATNTLTDSAGRTVVLAWVRGWATGRGWNGCLAAPRLLRADARSGVAQSILPEWLAALTTGPRQKWQGDLKTGTQVLDEHAGDQLFFEATLQRQPGTSVVLHAGHTDMDSAFDIAWRGDFLHVAGLSVRLTGDDADALHFQVLIDRSVIEVFVDYGRTVVTRVHVRPRRGTALVFTTHGTATGTLTWHRLRDAVFTPNPTADCG